MLALALIEMFCVSTSICVFLRVVSLGLCLTRGAHLHEHAMRQIIPLMSVQLCHRRYNFTGLLLLQLLHPQKGGEALQH